MSASAMKSDCHGVFMEPQKTRCQGLQDGRMGSKWFLMLIFLLLHDDTPINEKLQSNAYYTITISDLPH
jgi:hypothetical protein